MTGEKEKSPAPDPIRRLTLIVLGISLLVFIGVLRQEPEPVEETAAESPAVPSTEDSDSP